VTNALAYFTVVLITTVKCFIVQAHERARDDEGGEALYHKTFYRRNLFRSSVSWCVYRFSQSLTFVDNGGA
jgi:hypothetical protein